MKSLVLHAAQDLRLEERKSGEPGRGQVRVAIATGGICGSDLHYYNHGGFGDVRLREPMILGHEVAGHVAAIGEDVTALTEGQLVAISPSRPCHDCAFCHEGKLNHCMHMRFYGSAMPFPHIQGAFRQDLVVDAAQCAIADGLSPGEAAMAEPLAVCLHAAKQAGQLLGKRVLVTGCGPIGLLAILCARRAGATEIVATDLSDFTLGIAAKNGADRVINASHEADALLHYTAGKGTFDVLFECTGAAAALNAAIPAMLPQASIVQLGLGGDMTLAMQAITAKELCLRGSFRFHDEFFTGVKLMQAGLIDVSPLITHTFVLSDAQHAFEIASDRTQAMKTQIAFS